MTEWLLLMLLVPVVVVPVVLLFGFAGCDRVFGLQHVDPVDPPPPGPIIDAKGTSVSTIRLTWMIDPAATEIDFVRTKYDKMGHPVGSPEPVSAPASPGVKDDGGLDPNTTYGYVATAVFADGESSE